MKGITINFNMIEYMSLIKIDNPRCLLCIGGMRIKSCKQVKLSGSFHIRRRQM